MNRVFWTASTLALVFCVLAAVGTPSGGRADAELIYVLDVSRSHGPAPDLLLDRTRRWHENSSFANRAVRVILAGTTAVESADAPPGLAEGSRVDLGLALARTTRRDADTVVVLSDGRFDHERAAREVEALAAQGVVVRFEGPLALPALDMRLVPRGPAPVEGGRARVRVGVTGTNREPREVSLRLIGTDDPNAGASIVVAPGATEELEALVPVAPSARSVTARIALAGGPDAAPSNDELAIPLQRAERRALVVGTRSGLQAPVVIEALEASGFGVETLAGMSELHPARFADLDLLVLVDQALASEPEALLREIETAVTRSGLGLWVVGGEHAFGAGGYGGTIIDDLLPLSSRASAARRIVVVLDTSGSMEKDDRIGRSIASIVALAETLSPEDRIQVIPFAQQAMDRIPAEPVSPEEFLARAIPELRTIAPRGGTRLLPALDAALARPRGGSFRDVLVLITDANDDEAGAAELAARREAAAREKIASIVVLLDPTVETRARADAIATAKVVPVTDFGRRILVDVLDDKEPFVRGPIASMLPGGSPGPEIAWWNRVRAGTGALVALATMDREPLMASAFRGVGTTAAWAAWPARRSDAAALATEWAHKTARPPDWKEISVRREDGRLVVAIPAARVPAGPIAARSEGGGRWSLAERTPGIFVLGGSTPAGASHLTLLDGDRVVGAVAVPPAGDPEYAWPPILPAPGPPVASSPGPRVRAPWAVLALASWAAAVAIRRRRA